jgi:glyoxylase-like metal-dependent hydrolase (beta-lactamase superfamily II)
MNIPFEVGDLIVHRIVETEGPVNGPAFEPLNFFPALTRERLDENRSWMEPRFLDPTTGRLILCIQSYIVRTPHQTLLIDSCVGNHKERPNYPFWSQMTSNRYEQNLAAAGYSTSDIDIVMCTHLHVDHVGWNTRLENGRWVPTFPKAKYVFSDKELAFWTEKEKSAPGPQPWITDSVLPIISAGRQEIVRSDYILSDVVRLIPTPGHTIDHFSVRIGRKGADAVLAGDMIHSPIQARYPDLAMRVDYNPTKGSESRRKLFSELCDTSTLLCPAHFPGPSIGRLTRWGDGFRFNT